MCCFCHCWKQHIRINRPLEPLFEWLSILNQAWADDLKTWNWLPFSEVCPWHESSLCSGNVVSEKVWSPRRGRLLNAHMCMKAPRLPALLQCHVCCRNGQPICTQCKCKPLFAFQQSSSALAKMRLLILHVMTYLMSHFPEAMRTCNYPYAQCELGLLSPTRHSDVLF